MINRVIIEGFTADEPYVIATESGKFVRLRVATIEELEVKKHNTIRQHTEWHTVALWGELADRADKEIYIGTPIYVEGHLRYREWLAKDGTRRNIAEILATSLKVLDPQQMSGYTLPKPIAEKMPKKRARQEPPTESTPLKSLLEDPDKLPF